jgi:putative proteasome-type protease
MTYCVALKINDGMIFASDSRTNAGVDHVSIFTKMRVYENPGDRVVVILSSGNLAITQGVINLLDRHERSPDAPGSLWSAPSLYDVTVLVGDALREMQRRDGPWLMQNNIDASASLIVGGQVRGETMRLFNVYAQGNFIEAMEETPYFQLGESKYGKPILDRTVTSATSHRDAAKCVLVSFDSTMKSNISVGLPIDLLWLPRDRLAVGLQQRIRDDDPYYTMLGSRWAAGVRRAFSELPDPDWLD